MIAAQRRAHPHWAPTEKLRHQFGVSEDMTGERSFQFGTLRATLATRVFCRARGHGRNSDASLRVAGASIPDIAKIIRALCRALRNAPFTDLRRGRIDIPDQPMRGHPPGASGSSTIKARLLVPAGTPRNQKRRVHVSGGAGVLRADRPARLEGRANDGHLRWSR